MNGKNIIDFPTKCDAWKQGILRGMISARNDDLNNAEHFQRMRSNAKIADYEQQLKTVGG